LARGEKVTSLESLDVQQNLKGTLSTLEEAARSVEASLQGRATLPEDSKQALEVLLKKIGEAEEYYARALDSKELYDRLAAIHRSIGDQTQAAHFEKRGNTFVADELEFKGRLQAFYGNHTKALGFFDEALRLVPDHAFSLKDSEASRKRVEKANKDLEKLKGNANSKNTSKDWLAYGSALFDLGRVDEALAGFEKAIASDGTNPDALARKGTALHAMDKVQEALEWYRKALEIKPTSMVGRRGVNFATFQIENPQG
jgi:tetratricopeptide (TPR) repeat protein